ncbi:hypothetical protein D8674_026016 [Pyrus ussuriensis x Pyrus communis]|uniref:Uncharacterized protein n=1 Tax=Pyrus ussuriensis x Pyrus communis TaxID=2448454 RepID=A0A5N5IAJ1_9ROSA|nr:hypothetical protein D8674_026016 [Pyrus ussuriensis x Pyrus communis]
MISQFRNFMTQSDDLLLETPPQYTSLARAWEEYGNGRVDNPPPVVVSYKISDCAPGSPILLQSFQ